MGIKRMANMKRKKASLVFGALASVVLLATMLFPTGCSKTSSAVATSSTGASSVVGVQGGYIVLGAVNSMTGTNAFDGATQKWAYEQAVKDINAAGGIYVKDLGKKFPVKIDFEDDTSTPDGAAAAMERLVKVDHTGIILSTNIGSFNDAAAVVADKYKVYYAGAGGWWGEEFTADKANWASCIFPTAAADAAMPFEIWNLQPADQRPQKVAVLVMDDVNGQGFAKGCVAAAQQYHYDIVSNDVFTTGTKDFSANILKIKAANADALLWIGSPTDAITLVQQIKAANLNLKYLEGWMGMWPNQFATALGADANYIVCDGMWSASEPYPGNQKLDQEFRAAHNGDGSVTAGIYYANVQVVAQAIQNAGSLDPAAVRNAVYGGTFKGTTMGDLTFNSNGYCQSLPVSMQWWNGEREMIWPQFSSNTNPWALKWMPAWNQR